MTRLPSTRTSSAPATAQLQCINMIRHVIAQVDACHWQTRRALTAIQERLLPQVSELDNALEQYEECCEKGVTPDAAAFRMAVIDSDIEIATSLRAEVYDLTRQTAERGDKFIRKHSAGQSIQRDQAKRDARRLSDLCDWLDGAYDRLQMVKSKQESGAKRFVIQPGKKSKTQATGPGLCMQSMKRPVAGIPDAVDEFDDLQDGSTKRQKTILSRAQFPDDVLDQCSDSDTEMPGLAEKRKPSPRELQQTGSSTAETKKTHSVDLVLATHIASSILRTMGHHPELTPLNHEFKNVLSRRQLKKNKQRDADVAVAQDKTVRDALGWWKAQGCPF